MAAPFELPGYYWDEGRQKFFKIEKTGTAPPGASWAQAEVTHRQKLEQRSFSGSGSGSNKRQKRAEGGERAHGGRAQAVYSSWLPPQPPAPIVRAAALGRLAVRLERPLDSVCFGRAAATAPSSMASAAAAAVARSLCYRGQVGGSHQQQTAVSCLYVHDEPDDGADDGGEDEARTWPRGLGVLYTSARDVCDIQSHYIPRNNRGFIPSSWPVEGPHGGVRRLERPRSEGLDVPEASAICYHEPSRRLLVTSRQLSAGDGVCMHVVVPSSARHPTFPHGSSYFITRIYGRGAPDAVYSCAAAPASAAGGVLCVVGAGRGLALIDGERLNRPTATTTRTGRRTRTATSAAAAAAGAGAGAGADAAAVSGRGDSRRAAGRYLADYHVGQPPADDESTILSSSSPSSSLSSPPPPSSIVTTVDFWDGHPQLVLAGGRRPHPWLVDLRQDPLRGWHALGDNSSSNSSSSRAHANAVAHVRSVHDHRVVAAGLRDTMLLYDVRCLGGGGSGPSSSVVLRFDEYRNEARLIGTAFDVEPALGLVAVADDRNDASATAYDAAVGGGLSLFSLATGERLAVGPDMTRRISQPSGCYRRHDCLPPSASEHTLPNVAAVRFARLPGDRTSNLFVAAGTHVSMYSLGDSFGSEDNDGPEADAGPEDDAEFEVADELEDDTDFDFEDDAMFAM